MKHHNDIYAQAAVWYTFWITALLVAAVVAGGTV